MVIKNLSSDYGQIVSILLQERFLTKEQIEYAARIRSKIHSSKSLLTVIIELGYINNEQIRDLVGTNLSNVRVGDLLVELGLISEADLRAGLDIQSKEKRKRKLGEILIDHQFVEEKKLIEVLSLQLKIPIVEPEFTAIDREIFSTASSKLYDKHHFIPIRVEDQSVLVAFADPLDRRDLDEASQFFGKKIVPAIASKKSIQTAIQQMKPKSMSKGFSDMDVSSPIDIVNSIILAAIEEKNVSDIHFEPLQDRLRVRFRMDGVLIHHKDLPLKPISGITSRIKIMCEADITEKRRHQGGRIFFEHDGRNIDLRVSFYVTVHGEKIVMRILNRQAELLSINDIGMFPRMFDKFRIDALDCPSGVVIVTGPTGSGKTTTVYSCINYLNKPDTSIITAEEPVEYIIDGISQCSINPKINLTFEETLRHIVRQDPDVIVIGEIRDTFSAEVAVQAALTGHKVLTTFHTEDSIGGLIRLLNMDIDAFLISSTVVCVLAQRLLRKVCPICARPYQITPEEILRLGYIANEIKDAEFIKGRGCSECRHTGYKGRIAVFELLTLNENVRDGLLAQKTSHQIRKISIESTGLVTLLEDGIVKAASGFTTIDETLRCLPRLQKPRPVVELRRLLGV
ncbi:MAG: Flp pilus assembly complex ATPase component TadA [Desulfobacterales bacterium]|nr:MAG: Flp pilus assembly complex ATPase component TadA [Desulfobacterales bacterium]